MITYVRIEKGQAKRPVSVQRNPFTGRAEYCFGLSIWRSSVPHAWKDFQAAERAALGSSGCAWDNGTLGT
jgi:hypothetical protein